MKSLARMFVWWPGIDRDTERIVQLCRECQTSLSSPTLQPWKWPTHPWSRLHIDYAGPMYGKMCLIIVDVHSKWIEAGLFPRQLQLLPLNYSAIHSLALNFLISGCCQCTLLRQWGNLILFQTKFSSHAMFPYNSLRNTYVMVMCDQVTGVHGIVVFRQHLWLSFMRGSERYAHSVIPWCKQWMVYCCWGAWERNET